MIDIEKFEREYTQVCNTLEALCELYGIKYKEVVDVYDEMYEEVKEDCEQAKHLQAQINRAERISRSINHDMINKFNDCIDGCPFEWRGPMRQNIMNTLTSFMCRMAATRLLVDEYSLLDENTVSASHNAYEATRLFTQDVQTNIGWRNETQFTSEREIGEHGVKAVMNRWGQPAGIMEIGIDHTWDTVRDNRIQLVDIAGKKCLTVKAEEITEHDLVSDNVKLFKALVCYTKVPREHVGNFGISPTLLSTFYHFEEKYICVQPVTDGDPIIATGKSESWAIRTMRGRMKKKLFEMLDI